MPPHISYSSARLLYAFTALVAVAIVATVGFAGAGQDEAQCKGNSPKKICPEVVPADGATVSGTITVSAKVVDAVTSVTFEVDDVAIAPPERYAPYQVTWDTTKASNGAHVLEVTSVDSEGKTSTVQHRINVSNATAPPADTTPPSVTLMTPSAGTTVAGSVGLAANASDNTAVLGVQFKVDGTNVGGEDTSAPYAASWTSSAVSNGNHTLTAVARDAAGNSTTSQHGVNVSNTSAPPTGGTSPLTITQPAAGSTVSGTVTVKAVSTDPVTSITFEVDGVAIAPPERYDPYQVSWDTTKSSNGTHVLKATLLTTAGKTFTVEQSVTVSNGSAPPPPPPSSPLSITQPAAGSTVSGTVKVTAVSTDPVTSITFEVDGAAIAAPERYSPYEVSWDTTKSSNGAHVLKATLLTTAGKTWTAERSVTVSNGAETTVPTVALTSPASGATVSGNVAVAANASDNVGVVGVQFKIDGGNLGVEDTNAPYSMTWPSANVANGAHNVTAVARDAAGNRATTMRTVTVSNSSGGGGPTGTGPKLAWAPPTLSNFITLNVTNANRRLFLDNTRDYRLNIAEHLTRELWIEGGRNVVVVGGHITIDQLGSGDSYQDNTAVKIRYGAAGGTVHIEGLLIDGAYVADGIAVATPRNIQIENVRVERTYAIKGAHPDCFQTQAGAGAIRFDRFTCSTELQGIFLRDDTYAIGSSDFRHVNITGTPGRVLFWQTTPRASISLSEVWLHTDSPWGPFPWWVYPSTDGKTWDGRTDMTRVAVVSPDGSYLWFTGSTNTISGRINKGRPPNGDFVPRSLAGMSYASPGY
jgi:hypothetical protein